MKAYILATVHSPCDGSTISSRIKTVAVATLITGARKTNGLVDRYE
jgi:hypothetical protein